MEDIRRRLTSLENLARENAERDGRNENSLFNLHHDFEAQTELMQRYDERLKVLEKFAVKIGTIGGILILLIEILHLVWKR